MPRQILNPSADLTLYQLQVAKGGIADDNAPEGLDNIGGVQRISRNAVSGVAGLDATSKILAANLTLPPVATNTPTLQGSAFAGVGVASLIEITNYDAFTTYTLATANGSLTRSGSTLSYTPATAGAATFTVNGSVYNVTVEAIAPVAPTLVATVSGFDDANAMATLAGGAMVMNYGSGTQLNADWQIASDIGFSTVVFSSLADTVNKTTWSQYLLTMNGTFYGRVRYRDSAGNVGPYSNIVTITTEKNLMNVQQAKLVSTDLAANDFFGNSVAITADGNRVVIAARQATVATLANAGAAYVFLRTGTTWAQEAKLVASDNAAGAFFGQRVNISADGSRIVVSAAQATVSGFVNAGAVYVYLRTGTSWAQEQKLTEASPVTSNQFGFGLGLSADATRIAVGVVNGDNGGTTDCGTVIIFLRTGVTWAQEAILAASDKTTSNAFGRNVALSSDGTRVVVGSINSTVSAVANCGAAFVFLRTGTSWAQEALLSASVKEAGSVFGISVSIAEDGSRVAVGTTTADISGTTDAGAVYVYSRAGTTWTQEAVISAGDRVTGGLFGQWSGMKDDGSTIVIGSPGALTSGVVTGAFYYFKRTGTSWTQISKVSASDAQLSAEFSGNVGMSRDGTTMIAGSTVNDVGGLTNSGAAYIFTGAGYLLDKETAQLSAADKAVNDTFSHSLAISADGTRIVVGAYNATVSSNSQAGAAYVFLRTGTVWSQEAKLQATTLEAIAGFGVSVGITADATRVSVGSWKVDAGAVVDAGGVYIFLRTGASWAQEQKIVAGDPQTNNYFGQISTISADGVRMVASSYLDASRRGSVYVFSRSGTTWTQESKFFPGDAQAGDNFGTSLDITADGSRIIVSSPNALTSGGGQSGGVYVWSRSGTVWSQEAKLYPPEQLGSGNTGGITMGIADDGSRVAFYYTGTVAGVQTGLVAVFLRSGTTWALEASLKASDSVLADNFGASIAMNSDGSKMVIGARSSSPSGISTAGASYIFKRVGTTWTQESKSVASDKTTGYLFGFAVDISSDGTVVANGSRFATVAGVSACGAVYIFT